MTDRIELGLTRPMPYSASIGGGGELRIHLTDAAQASVGIDYTSPDQLILRVRSSVGVQLSSDADLTLGGGVGVNLLNKELSGEVDLRLKISKEVAASLSQEFLPSGPRTALTLKLTF
jgi:hypothetical protein